MHLRCIIYSCPVFVKCFKLFAPHVRYLSTIPPFEAKKIPDKIPDIGQVLVRYFQFEAKKHQKHHFFSESQNR